MVFILAVAVFDHGLAAGQRPHEKILSHRNPGYRSGNHFFLGRQDDHGGPAFYGKAAVYQRPPYRYRA